MNPGSALEIVSASDPGIVRAHNEDSLAAEPDLGLVVLADGMGGYSAGEVASGIAVAVLVSEVKRALAGEGSGRKQSGTEQAPAELLKKNIAKANASIRRAAKNQKQFTGMGTTLVAALFHDNRVAVGHVGDSRMYRLRGETLTHVTRDHSLLQEQIDAGLISKEAAWRSRNKNLVTRALGIDPHVDADVADHEVEPQDLYLFCSDGLNDMVPDDEIQLVLTTLQNNLELAANQLVQTANDHGGSDNVSVILVKVLGEFSASRGVVDKIFSWIKK